MYVPWSCCVNVHEQLGCLQGQGSYLSHVFGDIQTLQHLHGFLCLRMSWGVYLGFWASNSRFYLCGGWWHLKKVMYVPWHFLRGRCPRRAERPLQQMLRLSVGGWRWNIRWSGQPPSPSFINDTRNDDVSNVIVLNNTLEAGGSVKHIAIWPHVSGDEICV